MTIKINYKQLPRDLARNIILEDNPYKDDTSFVGQMLKHSISSLSEIYNPYKIYYISQDLDYLPCCYHHKDLYKLYKNNNATIAESLLDDCIDADFYKANNKMSVIISQKFHKDFYDIFDNNTGFVSKNKLIDLVNKHDAFALWFNDKSIEESEIEILYGRQVKIGDCNG